MVHQQIYNNWFETRIFHTFCIADSTEGYIREAAGEVISIVDGNFEAGTNIHLEAANESKNDHQLWVRDTEVSNGWFTLRNKGSGKLLTSKNEMSLSIEGMFYVFTLLFNITCFFLKKAGFFSS